MNFHFIQQAVKTRGSYNSFRVELHNRSFSISVSAFRARDTPSVTQKISKFENWPTDICLFTINDLILQLLYDGTSGQRLHLGTENIFDVYSVVLGSSRRDSEEDS